MQKTAIIVPCYNEGKRLNVQTFLDAALGYPGLHFIFVNDGSDDNTIDKLVLMHKANPAQLIYLDMKENLGKAEAVRQGFLKAIKMEFSLIGYWDADLATPLKTIPVFCRILDDPDVELVMGSRVKLLGRRIERRAYRHFAGRVFATLAGITLRLPVYDTQCGAKLFKNSSDLSIVFNKPFTVNWTFDVEILARLSLIKEITGAPSLSDTVIEYPLDEWADVSGSKLRWTDFFITVAELLKICRFLHIPALRRRYISFLGVDSGNKKELMHIAI